MLATTSCEKQSASRFRAACRAALTRLATGKHAVRIRVGKDLTRAELAGHEPVPKSDAYYLFDSGMMRALGDAIEEMALSHSRGELVACLQHFANFGPKRQRYEELAARLKSVRVWGAGHRPRACGGIDFVPAHDPALARYWMVLYTAEGCQAVLLCRQMNHVASWPDKKFVGFFSFNPYLAHSIRRRFGLLSSGLRSAMTHWEKAFPLPDFELRDLQRRQKASAAKGKTKTKAGVRPASRSKLKPTSKSKARPVAKKKR